jgi:hypothetical protein
MMRDRIPLRVRRHLLGTVCTVLGSTLIGTALVGILIGMHVLALVNGVSGLVLLRLAVDFLFAAERDDDR